MIDRAVDAIQRGKPIILPTDTVYGLARPRLHSDAVRNLYRLKHRPLTQPTALLAPDVEMLFELVPELRGRAGVIARVLLPGPYTLVLPNPARRYSWLTGTNYDAIGVRVPELPEPSAELLARVSALAATSANLAGGRDPATARGRSRGAEGGGGGRPRRPGAARRAVDRARLHRPRAARPARGRGERRRGDRAALAATARALGA